jgi:ribose 5-phosphate isomerase B
MKIALGNDHLGFSLKQAVAAWLEGQGHDVLDMGNLSAEADARICDYADTALAKVKGGGAERAILICQSGGFMVIRANKWAGLRAVVALTPESVAHDRQASDINVLGLAAGYMGQAEALACVGAFLETPFEPLPRRVARLARLEEPGV